MPHAAADSGLPWFNYYDADATALDGAGPLTALSSVADMGKKNGEAPLPENESVVVERVIGLGQRRTGAVREIIST